MILTLGAIRQLCVVGSYLACAAARALEAESVAFVAEATAKGVEGVGEFRGGATPNEIALIRRITRRQLKHIEAHCEDWLADDLGVDWRTREPDAEAALAALEHVLPACMPGADGFAQEDLSSDRIVQAALARATALDWKDRTFAPGGIGYIALGCLLAHSVAALEGDPEFRGLLQLSGLRELLRRSREHREALTDLHADVSKLPAETVSRLVAALDARGETRRAEQAGLERQAVIRLAQRLTPNEALDFDQAVIELEKAVAVALDVIARGERGSNLDAFVDDVLVRVAEKTRVGDFDGATDAVDQALIELNQKDAEQRDTFRRSRTALLEAGLKQDLLRRDPSAAARRIESIAGTEQSTPRPAWSRRFVHRANEFRQEGEDRGINLSLAVAAEMALRMAATARDGGERVVAANLRGNALSVLGERETGPARLEQAVAAYRDVLREQTRENAPLDWAMTQTNLGVSLMRLGEREAGTERLEQAVAAFRDALTVYTRGLEALDWARAQCNLGIALSVLGEREAGTTRLQQAVVAYREALKEWTRERVPLQWAKTQNNLGTALSVFGEREAGTGRLKQAVAAFRDALKEQTRERAPLRWAETQTNLGTALAKLASRGTGTGRLEQAVAAFRDALKEQTRDRTPHNWATTQTNLGIALLRLGEQEAGTARLEQAIAAFSGALEEYTREDAPLQWAMIQTNLGLALSVLGEREAGTTRLEQGVATFRYALEEHTREGVPLQWAITQTSLGNALTSLGERETGTARLEESVAAYRAALEVPELASHRPLHSRARQGLARAERLLNERRNQL